jgi:hypothetical protein
VGRKEMKTSMIDSKLSFENLKAEILRVITEIEKHAKQNGDYTIIPNGYVQQLYVVAERLEE